MATRTISNAGGNYNSTGTWVEAAVPTSADDVVATATSGQLTVNVSSAARTFNFTNYTNTLTVNASWTISGASLTSTFVTAMNIVQTANITFNSAHSIQTNGKSIPRVAFGIGAGTKTLLDELKVTDVFSNTTNAIVNGATLSISAPTTTFQGNLLSGSTTTVVFNPTQSQTLALQTTANHTVPIVIDADATITVTNGSFGFASTTVRIPQFRYIKGTFSSPPSLYYVLSGSTVNATFSISSGNLQLNYIYAESNLHTGARCIFNLDTDVRFRTLSLNQIRGTIGQQNQGVFRFASTGRLIGGAIISSLNTTIPSDNLIYSVTPKIELSSGPTHSVEEMYIFGNPLTNLSGARRLFEVTSFTASTISYLAITGTHSIVSASFSDIDASLGNPVKVFRTNLGNTTNITNYNDLATGGGGGGGGSFTFVN
jgi:hypothetical protein